MTNEHDPSIDERIRAAMRDAERRHEPPAPDAADLTERIINTSTPSRMTPTRTASIIGGLGVIGAAIGITLGVVGPGGSSSTSAATALRTVSIWDCPDSVKVGTLIDGDRIVATARSENGGWLEIRSPYDLGSRVWVAAAAVAPDASPDQLPVADCDTPQVPAVTTTTSAPPDDSIPEDTTPEPPPSDPAHTDPPPVSEPTSPASTTTVAPSGTSTTTTTTAPPPPDTTGPTLSGLNANPGAIWTQDTPSVPCVGPKAQTTSVVSVNASDPSGVVSAQLEWSVNGHTGSKAMTRSGSTWSATLGEFAHDTLPISGSGMSQPIAVTVRVTDGAGNTTVTTTTVTLTSYADCFG